MSEIKLQDSLAGVGFQKLFESVPGLYLVVTPDLTIVAGTDEYFNATMTTREGAVGKGLFEVFPDNPSDPDATGTRNLRASLDAVLRYKKPNTMPFQKYDIRRPDGEFEVRFWSPVNVPVIDEYGDVTLIIHRVEDVTEVVRLGHAQSDLDRFFTISLDMLCIASADGYFKRVSPAFTKTLGWSVEEMTNKPFLDFVHPEDHAATLSEVERQISSGEMVIQFENRYRHKDGSWRVLSWKSIPQDGLMYATARDVTDAQQATQDLLIARSEADRANRAKSEFLSRMSHELRTPMNAVIGYAQLLEMQSNDAKVAGYADAILKGGRHLLSLINEILDLARIEAGKLALSLEPVSLKGVIEQVVELVAPVASEKGVSIQVIDCAKADVFVWADQQRLAQIFINLISNGIKFNRTGGSVSIRCGNGSERLRVDVSDTGFGIGDEYRHLMFEPFERFGHEGIEGTGLGLALSRSLAQVMGGDVSLVETGPGGTTFAVELRSSSAPRATGCEGDDRLLSFRDTGQRPLQIVYVEDNRPNLQLLQAVFEEFGGVELHSAGNARDGAALVKELLPDLVLLDLHLPDMHGLHVLESMKANPVLSHIPVIVVSADATPTQIKRLLDAGAKAYLTKPLDIRLLIKEIQEVRNVMKLAA